MNIQRDVVDAISETTGISDIDSDLDITLKDLGVSSIEFFKIILALSKKINIDLQDLDPEKVTSNMTIKNMMDYFCDSTPVIAK